MTSIDDVRNMSVVEERNLPEGHDEAARFTLFTMADGLGMEHLVLQDNETLDYFRPRCRMEDIADLMLSEALAYMEAMPTEVMQDEYRLLYEEIMDKMTEMNGYLAMMCD